MLRALSQKKAINGVGYNYLLSEPPRYNNAAAAGRRYPLLLFLHGAGEGARGSGGLALLRKHGVPKLVQLYEDACLAPPAGLLECMASMCIAPHQPPPSSSYALREGCCIDLDDDVDVLMYEQQQKKQEQHQRQQEHQQQHKEEGEGEHADATATVVIVGRRGSGSGSGACASSGSSSSSSSSMPSLPGSSGTPGTSPHAVLPQIYEDHRMPRLATQRRLSDHERDLLEGPDQARSSVPHRPKCELNYNDPPADLTAATLLAENFITVSPQVDYEKTGYGWRSTALLELLDEVIAEHRVDPDRIHVTGISMGGYGCWRLAMDSPERFASAVPICGGGEASSVGSLLGRLPALWAFHGARDDVISERQSARLIDTLRNMGAPVLFDTVDGTRAPLGASAHMEHSHPHIFNAGSPNPRSSSLDDEEQEGSNATAQRQGWGSASSSGGGASSTGSAGGTTLQALPGKDRSKWPAVQYTVYAYAAHDCWTDTYNNTEVWQWMLACRRR